MAFSVWRGTEVKSEGGGVDTHRERHLEEYILTPGNKRQGAYGCFLDLTASRYTSEISNSWQDLCSIYYEQRGNDRECNGQVFTWVGTLA